MSIIPLHLQRRLEQRWATRFGSLVVPAVPKNVGVKARRQPCAAAKPRKTRRDGSAGSRSCEWFSLSLSEGGRTMESDLDDRNREN
jgi:hypothetical protein